jgi:hypothetical protein
VNETDAVFVYRAVFGLAIADWTFDTNGNGMVTVPDGVFMQQAFFGILSCA